MAHTLHRSTFETSRLLEYFSPKELSMQLGAEPPRWGLVLLKELVDNALDACETAGTAPHIRITLSPEGFVVEDNGPGLPASTVERSLDYRVRVSDKSYYMSPTRGQLGNALKCLWAAPYVVNPDSPGRVEVTSRGVTHAIAVAVDQIAQEPKITYTVTEAPFVKIGTIVQVESNQLACYPRWGVIDDFYKSVHTLVLTYAACNPHAHFTLQLPDETLQYPATTPSWTKWRPSDPTSPHWYALEHCRALIAAFLTRERAGGRALTVREFVKDFRGLHGSAKQKLVTGKAGLSRAYLHDLVIGDTLDDEAIGRLLAAMQDQSQRVKPQALGILGREHVAETLCAYHQVDQATLAYQKLPAEVLGLPCVLEVAFGAYQRGVEDERQVITGINWSPTPNQPFAQLEAHLNTALVSRQSPVVVVVHLAIPRPTFRDRGKQALALPDALEESLEQMTAHVTRRWTAARRRAYRSYRAEVRAEDELRRHERTQYPSVKAVAYQLMPQAYQGASGQGRYVAHARQMMYVVRPEILARIHPDKAHKGLNAQYFTQTLVPDFMSEHPELTAGWDVVFDDRGHFREPHRQNGRERIIGLGTLAVRNYITSWTSKLPDEIRNVFLPFDLETSGPTHRYHNALFVEKEGFDELIQQAQIAERFDIAPMSTKGMSNTAARRLVDELSRLGVTIYVLHDFDKSGFSILKTLRTDTRRYRFRSTPQVIDIGLTLADVQDMALQSEPVAYRHAADPKEELAKCGATPAEQAYLVTGERRRNPSTGKYYWPGQRVELNAMTSDRFVDWIERRLTEHGVAKVIPPPDDLAKAYQLARQTKAMNEELARLQTTTRDQAIDVPDDLDARVREVLEEDPALSWDAAVWKIVMGESEEQTEGE
jgi:DNA topoisomerase VI subunit B